MTSDPSKKSLPSQQEMFSRIAPRYDLINHLITGWQDDRWRKFAVRQCQLPASPQLLDIGTGTGKLAAEALRMHPDSQVTAADITLPMMIIGRKKVGTSRLCWAGADAGNLPFPEGTFDAVISAFLVRNLSSLLAGLKEQHRVLKTGGRVVILDTAKTPRSYFTPLIRFYLHRVIPTLGWLFTRERRAYQYLPESTEGFLRPEEMAAFLAAAGFKKVAYRQFLLGLIAVHWGEKS